MLDVLALYEFLADMLAAALNRYSRLFLPIQQVLADMLDA